MAKAKQTEAPEAAAPAEETAPVTAPEETAPEAVPETPAEAENITDNAAEAAMEKEFGTAETPVPETPAEAEAPEPTEAESVSSPQPEEPEPAAAEVPAPARDYKAEFGELLKVYPELYGQTLPDDLVEQWRTSPRDVLSVYDHYRVGQLTKQLQDTQAELARARQNTETAMRAPVQGQTGGPAAGTGDPFLDSFNRYFG